MSKNLCDDCAWKAYEDPEQLWDYPDDRRSHYIDDYFAMRKKPKKKKGN